MLINFNDLFLLSSTVNGIIHIGAHNLEELPDYLKGNVRRIIWIEANPEKYNFIEEKFLPISIRGIKCELCLFKSYLDLLVVTALL